MKVRDAIVLVLAVLCLTVTLFSVIPVMSVQPYDPWKDVNDDGVIDAKDYQAVKSRIPSMGTPLVKAYLAYDSGWVNHLLGMEIVVTHNLNITDWNDPNIIVDITGKTMYGELLRYLGLTGQGGWNKTLGGVNADESRSLIRRRLGGYAFAGFTESYGAGGWDIWLATIGWDGTIGWNKTYWAAGDEYAYSLIETSDFGFLIAGQTWSFGLGGDAFLLKTGSTGNLLWSQWYGGAGWEQANSVIQTGTDNYMFAGRTSSWGAGGDDCWLVLTNSAGDILLNKTYGGAGNDEATSLIKTSDGNYMIAGYTSSYGAGGKDAYLIKTDASGNVQWSKTYGGTGDDWANSLVQTFDGGYIFAGYTGSLGSNSGGWIVKTDADGNTLWSRSYLGELFSLIQTGDGGLACVSTATSPSGSGVKGFFLLKCDGDGRAQIYEWYGGSSEDSYARSLVQTMDGGYLITGPTWAFGAGSSDAWLIKTDANGNHAESGLIWVGSTPNTITLHLAPYDDLWEDVRVQIWKRK